MMIKRKHIVTAFMLGGFGGFVFARKQYFKRIQNMDGKLEKNAALVRILNEWIDILHFGRSAAEYLKEKGYGTVLIYGMGALGRFLLDELQTADMDVPAVIDRNAGKIFADTEVISPDDTFPQADCIIITPLSGVEEIKEMLEKKADCSIISLEELFAQL